MSYKGVKNFIADFKEPINFKKKAKERLKEEGETATKKAVEEMEIILKKEYEEAGQKGSEIHSIVQNNKTKIKNYIVEGWEEPVDKTIPPDPSTNILKNNTSYIEKKIVSEKYKLIGYADEVSVVKNFINIEDIKTSKKIYRSSAIKLKNGFVVPPKYYYAPIDNIQDCNFYQAALQMSLYMYILWMYNKKLKPGKLKIRHVKTNDKNEILEEELIEVPYLLEEVKKMLKHRIKNGI